MGMDVCGRGNKDAYFRNNVWYWHPLWDYVAHVAPELAGKVENGHSNDGDGLGKRDSLALARILKAELDSGRTMTYAVKYMADLAALPDKVCIHCNGTGVRSDMVVKGGCNGCFIEGAERGSGKERPGAAHCPFTVTNVEKFVAFLNECGGFRIY